MKILIDARWIFEEISGIGHYTREIIANLVALDQRNEYDIWFASENIRKRTENETGLAKAGNFKSRVVPYGVFSMAGQFHASAVMASAKPDIYHSTNYMIPFPAFMTGMVPSTKCVVTIHDVIPLIFPDHAPKSRKNKLFFLFKWLLRKSGRIADRIITVSNASRRDIINHLNIAAADAAKVKAVYNGVSTHFKPPQAKTPKAAGAPRSLLYVGRCDPYKNIIVAIKAFGKARAMSKFPLTLVIAGSPDPRYPEANVLADQLGLTPHIIWTGYVPNEDLLKLYQESDLLIHPSKYEGFGLQVVEAMASGLPVLCSNGGALPEVVGNAGITLDPSNEDGYAAKIVEILSDPARTAEMTKMGLLQSAGFTWRGAARETLKIYESLVV